MKNLLLTLITFCAAASTNAQDFLVPNYDSLTTVIKTDTSGTYEALWSQFEIGDTSLSLSQKHFIYYGYTAMPNYSPLGKSDYGDSLSTFLQKESMDSADLEKFSFLTLKALEEEPFNLTLYGYVLYAAEKLDKIDLYNIQLAKANVVLDAVLGSGDGLTLETPFYVINVSHEYALLNILGFQFGGQQELHGTVDYLKVAKNMEYIEGFYFDVSPSFRYMDSMFDTEEDDESED